MCRNIIIINPAANAFRTHLICETWNRSVSIEFRAINSPVLRRLIEIFKECTFPLCRRLLVGISSFTSLIVRIINQTFIEYTNHRIKRCLRCHLQKKRTQSAVRQHVYFVEKNDCPNWYASLNNTNLQNDRSKRSKRTCAHFTICIMHKQYGMIQWQVNCI